MLFNSWLFLGFLALVLPAYYAIPKYRLQNLLLVIASYVFYSIWDWRFTGLLALSTVLDYTIALYIDGASSARRRRWLVSISVAANLCILGFFKYFNFFVDSAVEMLRWAGVEANQPVLQIILPVGISFYTFQTLGYTVDVYRGQRPATRDFLTYSLYVCYFPQLVAGPIERAAQLLPQFERPRSVTRDMFHSGVQLILWGYVKKVAIADGLAPHVEHVFSNPAGLSALELWIGVYCFALQIYADFSGYTDIARGVSRLFGVELMLNFRQPYLSRNITEFWRRWHISLSTWLRDYVYITLGGNRRGTANQYRNLMLTMLIGGLWHGASWNFVIWGGLHGAYLTVHKAMTRGRKIGAEPPPRTLAGWATFIAGAALTLHLVCLAWVWFRADSLASAWEYATGLFTFSSDTSALFQHGSIQTLVFYACVSLAIDLPCWYRDRELPIVRNHPWALRGAGYAAGMLILAFFREGTSDAFIYFQF